MAISKARLERSLDAIVEKAEFCSELAKVQRATADKQHQSAHKLEKLSEALTEDVAEIKDEMATEKEASPHLQPPAREAQQSKATR